MGCKNVCIGDVATYRKDSIKPVTGITYRCYSLPAFDNCRSPEILDGSEILSSKLKIEKGDILVNKLNMRFKRIWPLNELDDNSVCSTEFLPLHPKESVDSVFLLYTLLSDSFTKELSGMRTGTSGSHQRVKPEWVLGYRFDLPDLDCQRKIGIVLAAIDLKIACNAKINGYLAEIADALFTDAFGNLEDNAVLSDIANIIMGQSPAGTSYNEEGVGTVFYQGRGEFGWRYPTQRLFTTEPKRMAKSGDVLMSVRAPVGDLNLAYEDCCIGRGLVAISCDYPSYCLYLMRSLGNKLDAYNGEGTVFGSISGKALKGIGIVLPGNDDIAAFEAMVAPIDAQIRCNETESRILSQLRDVLLPKLMSGEIDVSKVDLTQLNSHLSDY